MAKVKENYQRAAKELVNHMNKNMWYKKKDKMNHPQKEHIENLLIKIMIFYGQTARNKAS